MAVREKLLDLRERIINGEKFSTLARIYSEDPGSARKGGELGMASKSIFWPVFSDAAMALKPGVISQIVETPDGFHIMHKSKYSGLYGDYSSFSEEYDELSDAEYDPEAEEESSESREESADEE